VPYALQDHDSYLNNVRARFAKIGLNYKVRGIHEETNPADAVAKAQAIFIGQSVFSMKNCLVSN
jgi:hypothetical protein